VASITINTIDDDKISKNEQVVVSGVVDASLIGQQVIVSFEGASGATIEANATIGQNGVFTVTQSLFDDTGSLVGDDGEVTVRARVGEGENEVISNSSRVFFATVPTVILDPIEDANIGGDEAVIVTGTALNVNAGDEVTVAFSDASGQTLSTTALVDENGEFSVEQALTTDATTLNNGDVTVSASVEADSAVDAAATVVFDATPRVAEGSGTLTGSVVEDGVVGNFFTLGAPPAGFTLNANGTFTFDANNPAYDGLSEGEESTLTVAFVDILTSAFGTFSLVVTGTNDAPIAEIEERIVLEGVTQPLTGTLTATDVDSDTTALTFSAVGDELPAGLSLSADGRYSFDASDPEYDSLAQNITREVTLTFTVTDAQGAVSDPQTLRISVTGTNDAPIAQPATDSVLEGLAPPILGNLSATDADIGEGSLSFTAVGNGVPDGLTLFSDGRYIFDANDPAYDSLSAGETVDVVLTFRASDQSSFSQEQTLTLTVTGTNDLPVAEIASASVTEGAGEITGTLEATDVDSSSLTFTAVTLDGSGDVVVDANGDVLAATSPAGLSLNADGTFTFDSNDPAYDALGAGVTSNVVVNFAVIDGDGGVSAPQTLTIAVTGTNDVPVAIATQAGVDEGAILAGQLTAEDADATSLTFKVVGDLPEGLVLDSDGKYRFDATDPAYDDLAENVTRDVTLTFTVTDDQSSISNEQTLSITVTGTNDVPVAENASATAIEGVTELVAGSLTATDVDSSSLTFTALNSIPGLTLNSADGTFTFDATNSAFDRLGEGITESFELSFTVTDEQGGVSAEQSLSISVTGTNDTPLAQIESRAVNEDSTIEGTLSAIDPDQTSLTFQVVDSNGNSAETLPPGLVVNADGSYTFDAGNAAYQSLGAGITQQVAVLFAATDDKNVTSEPQALTITVTGTNDDPVIAGVSQGTLTEGSEATTVSGALTVADLDVGESFFVETGDGVSLAGTFGSLTITENGGWAYTLDNTLDAVQSLVEGQAATDTITVTTKDGTEQIIEITVIGTNNAAVIGGDISATIAEDETAGSSLESTASAVGNVIFSSTESGVSIVLSTVSGNETGQDSEEDITPVNAAVNEASLATALGLESGELGGLINKEVTEGSVYTQTFGVASGDVLSFNVVFSSGESVKESFQDTAFLIINGQTVEILATPSNREGGLFTHTFSEDEAGQVTIAFGVVDVTDSGITSELILSNLHLNDVDIVTGDAVENALDLPSGVVTGSLTIADVDAGENTFQVDVFQGDFGVLTLASDGHYSYQLDNTLTTVQQLGINDTVTDTFTVKAADGTTQEVTINITGTNDLPVAVADVGGGDENQTVTVDVIENDADIDQDTNLTLKLDAVEPPIAVDAEGVEITLSTARVTQAGNEITFNPGSDFDFLASGDIATVTIGYTVEDGDGGDAHGTFTLSVVGTNDDPVANADSVGIATEDGQVAIDVIQNDADVDQNAVLSLQENSVGIAGAVNIDGSDIVLSSAGVSVVGHAVVFDAGDDFNFLNQGDTATVTINYTVIDEHGGSALGRLSVNVSGTNDDPVAGIDSAGIATEDGQVSFDVIENDSDVDQNAVLSLQQGSVSIEQAVNIDDSLITLSTSSVSVNGNRVVFDAGDDFDFLNQGDNATVIISYIVVDENGGTAPGVFIVTLAGTNDNPVASADSAGIATEDGQVSIDVIANDNDVDQNAQLSLQQDSVRVVGATGAEGAITLSTSSVSVNGNRVVFDAGDDFDFLGAGASATVTINYTVVDEQGGTANGILTVTVAGTNDEPIAVTDTLGTLQGQEASINVILNDTDVDTGTELHLQANSVTLDGATAAGQPVTISSASVSQLGDQVTFDPGSDFDFLNVDESATVTVQYTVEDGSGGSDIGTLTVTVTGTNDAPQAIADSVSTIENTAVSFNVISNDNDLDKTAVLSLQGDSAVLDAVVTGTGENAQVLTLTTASVSQLGNNIRFNPGSDFDFLNVGNSATVSINYTVEDEHGATSNGVFTVIVSGTNDAPVAQPDTANTLQGNAISSNVITNDTDLDIGAEIHLQSDSASITDTPVTLVTASVKTLGDQVVFDPGSDFDFLGEGDVSTLIVRYTVEDENGATDIGELSITVTGTNDAPVAVTDSVGTLQDTEVSLDVIKNDTDIDGDTVSLTGAAFGGFSVSGSAADAFQTFSQAERTALLEQISISTLGDKVTVNPGPGFNFLNEGEFVTIGVSYFVSDGKGGVDGGRLDVVVTGTNDAPVATADSASTTEHAAISTDVIANDSDLDATGSFNLQGASANLSLNGAVFTDAGGEVQSISLTAGAVTQLANRINFNPGSDFDFLNADETATVTINYTVVDEHGATDQGVLSITVTGTNETPVAIADSASTTENAEISTNVISNDTDLDATASLSLQSASASLDSATFGSEGSVQNISLTSGAITQLDNSIKFNPGSDFDFLNVGETATVTITYTVVDDHGASSDGVLSITVTGTNDVPVAVADSAATTQNAEISTDVIANDSDLDATGSFNLQGASASLNGAVFTDAGGEVQSISLTAGAVTQLANRINFNPGSDFDFLNVGETAIVNIDYTVVDDNRATDDGVLSIIVTGTNDAPVAVADSATTTEHAEIATNVISNDTDLDNTAVFSLQGASANLASAVFVDADGNEQSISVTAGAVTQLDNNVNFNPGSDFDFLNEGESATVTIAYTVIDEHGATSDGVLSITVTGTNDAPVAVADSAATTENAEIATNVISNDEDLDDTAVLSLQGASAKFGSAVFVDAQGNEHSISITSGAVTQLDNNVNFNPGSDFDFLNEGESATVTINYTVIDDHSASADGILSITVTGTNDAPVAVADSATTTENAEIAINVISNDEDLDDTAVLSLKGASANLSAAVFVDADGSEHSISVTSGAVTQLDNNVNFNPGSDFDFLNEGESATVTIDYTVIDEHDATDNGVLTITVTGTNDAPVAVADSAATTENAEIATNVISNDEDLDDTAVLSLQGASAKFGSAVFVDAQGNEHNISTTSGAVTQLDNNVNFNPGSDFDFLNEGESATVTIDYTVIDEHGATDNGVLTITVTGTNDAPVAVADSAATTENAEIATNVISNDEDLDDTAVLSLQGASANLALAVFVDAQGNEHSISITSGAVTQLDNNVNFNPGSDFDFLNEGETATVTIDYIVIDDHSASADGILSITVTGTNDAPVAVADSATTTENAEIATNVISNDEDLDDTAVLSLQGASAKFGSAVFVDADGNEHSISVTAGAVTQLDNNVNFNPGSDFDFLNEGETATVTLDYTVIDDHGASADGILSITVTGTNDAPVAVADSAATTENAEIATNVISNDEDLDNTAVLSLQGGSAKLIDAVFTDAQGNVQTISVTSGAVTQLGNTIAFNPGSDFDLLPDGETATVTINYTVLDDNGAKDNGTLTITVTGTNDAPTITGVKAQTLTEDTESTSGKLDITDVDDGEAAFNATTITGLFGSLAIDDAGAWVYTLDNAKVQNLSEGLIAQDIITVTSIDGSPTQITVTVTGENDGATISGDTTGKAVTEDTATTVDGQLNITDPDFLDNLFGLGFDGETLQGTFGSLQINSDGSFTYTLDNGLPSVQALGENDTATDTVTVTAKDGTQQVIEISISGTNDDATIGGTVTGQVDEGGVGTATGTLTVSDIDSGEAVFTAAQGVAGQFGTLDIDANGTWIYTVDDAAVQFVGEGDTATDVITVRSIDGTEQSITITIQGENDKADIGGTTAQTITEDTPSTTGTLTITDVDQAESSFNATTLNANFGSLAITAAGVWTYTLDVAKAQVLDVGLAFQDFITVTALDGTEQQITVTIFGAEDAAVIVGTLTAVAADQSSIAGKLSISDVDLFDNPVINAGTIEGTLGDLSIDAGGNWHYTRDETALGTQDPIDVLTVTASDGTEAKILIGLNPEGNISGVVTGSSADVQAFIDNPDRGDILSGVSGAEDSLVGGVGDDILVYDQFDLSIVGGEGHDTLFINKGDVDAGGVVNLHNSADKIHDIESIQIGGEVTEIDLAIQDVLKMTDEDNELFIRGDDNDTVKIDQTGDNGEEVAVTKSDTSSEEGFTEYHATVNDQDLTLFIQNDINEQFV